MHDHLGSNIQNPSQKFSKNFIYFEKPQKLPKAPKVRLEMHELYDNMMKRGSYLWNMQDQNQRRSGEKIWSDLMVIWEVKRQNGSREIEKSEWEIARITYVETSKTLMDWELLRIKMRLLAIELAIEELSTGFLSNEARWIKETVEQLSRG